MLTMFSTLLLALFLTLVVGIWFARKWRSQTSPFAAQYADQKLSFVKMPNIMWMAFLGKQRVLIEQEAIKKHGPIFGTTIFGTKTIYVAEPSLIQLIMSKEFTSFTNRRKFAVADSIFGSFLSMAQDETWKRLRSIVTPMFSSGSLKRMKPRIDAAIKTLLSKVDIVLKHSEVINVKEYAGIFALDAILHVAFGTKVDSLYEPNNQIVANAKNKMFAKDLNFFSMLFVNIIFRFPKLLAFLSKFITVDQDEKIADFFKEFSLKLIDAKREELAKFPSGQKANNFLKMLLEAEEEFKKLNNQENDSQSKGGKFMSHDELIAQCVLFFFAAYDTTSSLFSLVTYNLALYPLIQERLYEEIITNLRELSPDTPVTEESLNLVNYDTMSRFKYLHAVINETLRLYPPNSTGRTASKDILLTTPDGCHTLDVRKGDFLHFPVYSIHHCESQFPDPENFHPERFLGEPTFHKYAFLPFGQGPRNCIARSLALFETQLVVMNIVFHYKLTTCRETTIPVQLHNNGQNLTPKEVHLKWSKRQM